MKKVLMIFQCVKILISCWIILKEAIIILLS